MYSEQKLHPGGASVHYLSLLVQDDLAVLCTLQ